MCIRDRGFLIAELLCIQDVAAQFVQQASDPVDDTGAVGTGQGEDVVGAHAGILAERGLVGSSEGTSICTDIKTTSSRRTPG